MHPLKAGLAFHNEMSVHKRIQKHAIGRTWGTQAPVLAIEGPTGASAFHSHGDTRV